MQALLVGHGGVTALGVNVCVMALPALLAALAFRGVRGFAGGKLGAWAFPAGCALGAATVVATVDLNAMSDAFNDVNGDKAVGGRVGLSVPCAGVIAGVSGLANGAYDRAAKYDLNVVDLDFSWHWCNWDVRSEFARTNQESPTGPIHRRGFYAQVAYRPYDACDEILRRLEGVVRYDTVRFGGIDLAATGTNFGGRELAPVGRNRYTAGVNYYPYPSLIVKLAFEVNDEVQGPNRRDNGVIAQVAWGF